MAIDPSGRLLIADTFNQRIRRVEEDGTLITLVGSGVAGFSGDGGLATDALVQDPNDVAVDALGRMVIADTGNHRIRRVETDGTITTIAGTGEAGFSGDGGPAINARLYTPRGVHVDPSGRVFIADTQNNRIRCIHTDGSITTVVGSDPPQVGCDGCDGGGGDGGASAAAVVGIGDGGPATAAFLSAPEDIAVDPLGRFIISDLGNRRVRRVELDGTIATVAGNGHYLYTGDGGPATETGIGYVKSVAVDSLGRLIITHDLWNRLVFRVELDGTISTIAGNGASGSSGDGGPASHARLTPVAVAVDDLDRIFIVDSENGRIRRIDVDGTITTVAGLVHPPGPGPVTRARLYPPAALVDFPEATLLSVGDFGRVVRVNVGDNDEDNDNSVDVVVGYDNAAPEAFPQARFAPLLQDARGVAFDTVALTLVITEQDTGDLRVIGLDPDDDGVIDDAGAWTNRSIATDLAGPAGIFFDAARDDFVVVDETDHCLKRIDRDGVVVNVVFGRCGTAGVFPGFLNEPTHGVLSPLTGAVYVADTGNHRVLRVQHGIASLVIGDGSVSSAGEGSPARLFPVNAPRQLALDRFGNLYVASTTSLRLVENIDGDDDADGDDRVTTIFGGGARDTFPESDTFCLHTVVVDDDDRVFAADACQGFLVKLSPTRRP